jgi:metallo-beta-lactamase family protein
MSGRRRATSSPRLRFLGAAGTVTGSRFLVERNSSAVLVDCGLYQGAKQLRLRNWHPWPFDIETLEGVVLTHAHIDHSGYLPRLYRLGYRKPVYCTDGTEALLRLLLPDAAHLQMEEAEYANRRGYSKHKPAEPLYTDDDAKGALGLLVAHPYEESFAAGSFLTASLHPAGHLLGSASVLLSWGQDKSRRTMLVSGDLGKYGDPFMRAPDPPKVEPDYLLVESTYGNRGRDDSQVRESLAHIVTSAMDAGGVLIIPSFAVGRTQEVLFYLAGLEREGRIPDINVYVDSPMAINATQIYSRFRDDLNFQWPESDDALVTRRLTFVRTPQESMALNDIASKAVIISASGMATGGRVLHHLRNRLPDERNTVMFAGFQVDGTRGRRLIDGVESIKLLGEEIPVRANVVNFGGFSAHGDREDLVRWVSSLGGPPRRTFVVHGEPVAAEALAARLDEQLGHAAMVPSLDTAVRLT